MSSNTTTVTHPDGTVSKRTSKTRVYTHAVVVEVPADEEIARLQDTIRVCLEHWLPDAYASGNQVSIDRYEGVLADRQAKLVEAQKRAGMTDYSVIQWSASLKSAQARARTPHWNKDGRKAYVVEVDA